MTEVEKLYSLAGVEPDYDYFTLFDDKVHKIGRIMHLCKEELKHWLENYQKDYVAIKVIRVDIDYPPFTAEKQIELIKWLCQKTYRNYLLVRYDFTNYYWLIECNMTDSNRVDNFSEALASVCNNLWQNLTSAEQNEIRKILE